MSTMDPYSFEPGDIILVYSRGKIPSLIHLGQSILRAPDLVRRKKSTARYSHVILAVGKGLAIHADGHTVGPAKIHELATDWNDWSSEGGTKVLRLADEHERDRVGRVVKAQAERWIDAKYFFGYAFGSSSLGRLLPRRVRSMQFCSKLVADCYREAGVPIGNRPSDQTLPVDIEAFCTPPEWHDVASDLAAAEQLDADASDDFDVEDEQTVESILEELRSSAWIDDLKSLGTESLLDELTDEQRREAIELSHLPIDDLLAHMTETLQSGTDSALDSVGTRKQWVESMVEGLVFAARNSHLSLVLAIDLVGSPSRLFRIASQSMQVYRQTILDLYSTIDSEGGPFRFQRDWLARMVPGLRRDQSPYEGLPTIGQIEDISRLGEVMLLAGKALLLETLIAGTIVGVTKPEGSDDRFRDLEEDHVERVWHEIPPLDQETSVRLLQRIDLMAIGTEEDIMPDIRQRLQNVVTWHRELSRIRDELT